MITLFRPWNCSPWIVDNNMFLTTLHSQLRLYFRRPSEFLNPLVFFAVVISLFPLGLGPTPSELTAAAPAVIWVATLLASLMSMDLMYREDFEDGTLDQVAVSNRPLVVYVAAKVTVHWLISGLPLVALIPFVGLVLYLPGSVILTVTTALLLVSPVLSLIGSIGAALTVGLPKGGLLVTLIVLPLYVPILILATTMADAALAEQSLAGFYYWLFAALFLALAAAPVTTAAALRISLDQ